MTSDDREEDERREDQVEAVLFEAISHPTRIKMLFTLERGPLGFSDLKRQLDISSSGNLQHHIAKLSTLVKVDSNGDYVLSDEGREALAAIRSVRSPETRDRNMPKVATIIVAFSFYIAQMNMPFIFGTVDRLTPVVALLGTIVFAAVYYPLSLLLYRRRATKTSDGI